MPIHAPAVFDSTGQAGTPKFTFAAKHLKQGTWQHKIAIKQQVMSDPGSIQAPWWWRL
jgi:hypothetical protein